MRGHDDAQTNHLAIGDFVLTSGGKYERVYSFEHYDSMSSDDCLVINNSIEISPRHLITANKNTFMPAVSLIEVGYYIMDQSDSATKIKSIETKTKKGKYSPFTTSEWVLEQFGFYNSIVVLFSARILSGSKARKV